MTEEDVRRIVLEVLAERDARRSGEMFRIIGATTNQGIEVFMRSGAK